MCDTNIFTMLLHFVNFELYAMEISYMIYRNVIDGSVVSSFVFTWQSTVQVTTYISYIFLSSWNWSINVSYIQYIDIQYTIQNHFSGPNMLHISRCFVFYIDPPPCDLFSHYQRVNNNTFLYNSEVKKTKVFRIKYIHVTKRKVVTCTCL